MQRVPHSIPFWIKTVLLEMVLSKQSRNYCLPKASGRFASGCLDLNPWLTKITMQQQTWHTTAPRPCSKTPTCHLSDAGSPCSWFLKSIGLADHAQVALEKKTKTAQMTWLPGRKTLISLSTCMFVRPWRAWLWNLSNINPCLGSGSGADTHLLVWWQRFQLEAGGTDRNVGDRVTLHH